MKNVLKTVIGLCLIGVTMSVLMSFKPFQDVPNRDIVIPKLPTFRGEVFPGFVEFKLQHITVNEWGLKSLDGEPFDCLVNLDYISKVYRYEDSKEKDYSCMMFFEGSPLPMLVRQEYDDVLTAIRRGSSGK